MLVLVHRRSEAGGLGILINEKNGSDYLPAAFPTWRSLPNQWMPGFNESRHGHASVQIISRTVERNLGEIHERRICE